MSSTDLVYGNTATPCAMHGTELAFAGAGPRCPARADHPSEPTGNQDPAEVVANQVLFLAMCGTATACVAMGCAVLAHTAYHRPEALWIALWRVRMCPVLTSRMQQRRASTASRESDRPARSRPLSAYRYQCTVECAISSAYMPAAQCAVPP
eukprot:3479380-Rhodomonas_salina.4